MHLQREKNQPHTKTFPYMFFTDEEAQEKKKYVCH